MKIYMTNGTFQYLQNLMKEYENEAMVLMTDMNTTLLLHETNGETVFNEPRGYEVIERIGSFNNGAFFVMNHIPVTEEGRPLFEHSFKYRESKIEDSSGFSGMRVCRPMQNNTYVIITFWENEASYQSWRQSEAFLKSHQKPEMIAASAGVKPKKLFAAPAFTTKYWLASEAPDEQNQDDWD